MYYLWVRDVTFGSWDDIFFCLPAGPKQVNMCFLEIIGFLEMFTSLSFIMEEQLMIRR
jgi:hypothetical protein